MKIIQIVKQLNNTELGKGGTHDTYVLIPNELDVTDIFFQSNTEIEFVDTKTKEKVILRNTVSREKRIVGLGQYYRKNDLSAGDEIVFERRITSASDSFFITTKKHSTSISFQKLKNGFEILTPERLLNAKEYGKSVNGGLRIEFSESIRKRNDSPDLTDVYSVIVNNRNIVNDFSAKEIGIIELTEPSVKVQKFFGWKKYVMEV